MKLNMTVLESMIIFAYKYPKSLGDEVDGLDLSRFERPRNADEQMSSYWPGEEYQVVKMPDLKLVSNEQSLGFELE